MNKLLCMAAIVSTTLAPALKAQTKVSVADWGKADDGQVVKLYTLKNADLSVRLTTFGARVVSIDAPDKASKQANVVLGYNNVAAYEADKSTYFGSIVGRYGNRIAKGTYTIDGKTFHAPLNNNGNMLHGGTLGFDHKVWSAKETPGGVEFTLVSPDGDMGFPGELTAHVRYTLSGKSLEIHYAATTTKPTVLNLTNHSYFNLSGEGSGDILAEQMMINAAHYTPVDGNLIPTGDLPTVEGTPFDFRKPTAIGARIDQPNEQLKLARGYDHNFVLDGGPGMHLAAKVFDPASGRTLTVTTTEPGVQFYSGNFLDGKNVSASGVKYEQHYGFCLETQHFPDSPNHSKFPTTVLRPGQTMHSTTVFTFGVEK